MVLVLELVGIGVLGACISVLLCIIAEGTPQEVLRAIGFRENLTKPRINECSDWQPRENGPVTMNAKLAKNGHRAAEKVRANGQKPCMDFQKGFKPESDDSVRNLYVNNKMTAVNASDDSTENPFPRENFQGSPDAMKRPCKYCKTLKIPNANKKFEENTRIFSIFGKSDDRLKNALVTTKNYEVSSEKLYNDEWTKVRTKKRKFVLPKTLVIDNQAKDTMIGDHGILDDDFIEEIICRHCYLEALRIKNNKAAKKSIDL